MSHREKLLKTANRHALLASPTFNQSALLRWYHRRSYWRIAEREYASAHHQTRVARYLSGERNLNTYVFPYVNQNFAPWSQNVYSNDYASVLDPSGCPVRHSTSYCAYKIRELTGSWIKTCPNLASDAKHWVQFLCEAGFSDVLSPETVPDVAAHYVGVSTDLAHDKDGLVVWFEGYSGNYPGTVQVSTFIGFQYTFATEDWRKYIWVKIPTPRPRGFFYSNKNFRKSPFPRPEKPFIMNLSLRGKEVLMAKKPAVETNEENKTDGKTQALNLAIAQITKQFGDGSIMKLGDAKRIDVQLIPSGSLSLDLALGGGYPKGRIIEIYGPESSGKTTLTLHAIAEIQKQGGTAAFIDAEHALDPAYAKRIGVDTDNLLISQPDNGEQALEICETLVRSGAVDLIVVDSVAALVPQAEIDGDMGDAQMGLQARLMSQAMRKLTGIISKSKATVIFINQIRMKIGVMFGNPETTTGGNALKFYASVRLDIRRIGQIKDGDNISGNRTKVKIVKNKIAAPFRTAEFDIMYNEGISKVGDVLDLAVHYGIVDKAGAFLKYNGETLGQGREAVKKLFREKPELMQEIEDKVRAESARREESA